MKLLIVGGGMAGLTCGIVAAKNNWDVTVCERNARVGKKLAQTGNGRCNIGNANVSAQCFNNSKVAKQVCSQIPLQQYLQFLQSCGIQTYDDGTGRLYPLSESAANVVDCLRFQYEKHGGKLLCQTTVFSIEPKDNGFCAHTSAGDLHCNQVVVACGSGSSAPTVDVASLCNGNFCTPLFPSLVPLKTQIHPTLNGLRAKATATLLADGVAVAQQKGEVQFRNFGLSGICIFNLSAHIARQKVAGQNHNYTVSLDVVPALSQQQLQQLLASRNFPPEKAFLGILHNTLAQYVVKTAPSQTPQGWAQAAKNLRFGVQGLMDFSHSQVTSGGIDDKHLDAHFRLPNGIAAVGEVLNVDGLCGGNNLYFAAASALCLFDKQTLTTAYQKL